MRAGRAVFWVAMLLAGGARGDGAAPLAPQVTPPPVAAAPALADWRAGGIGERSPFLGAHRLSLSAGVDLTSVSDFAGPAGTGTALSLALDLGVSDDFQIGAFVEVPLDPYPLLGTIDVSFDFRLARAVALRLDMGFAELLRAGQSGTDNEPTMLSGVGLPLRFEIRPWLWFVSGSTAARRFGPQPYLASADGRTAQYNAGLLFTDDLYMMMLVPAGSGFQIAGALTLPVGLMALPHQRVAITLRSGFRMLYVDTSGPIQLSYYVPLALDVTIKASAGLDVGASFAVGGYAGDNGAAGPAPGYFSIRQFDLWLGYRL